MSDEAFVFQQLDAEGEPAVQVKFDTGFYGSPRRELVAVWLRAKEREREEVRAASLDTAQAEQTSAAWAAANSARDSASEAKEANRLARKANAIATRANAIAIPAAIGAAISMLISLLAFLRH